MCIAVAKSPLLVSTVVVYSLAVVAIRAMPVQTARYIKTNLVASSEFVSGSQRQ